MRIRLRHLLVPVAAAVLLTRCSCDFFGTTGALLISENDEMRLVLANLLAEQLGMSRATPVINIQPIWFHTDFDDFGPKLTKYIGCNVVGRAISAINNDFQSSQINF